MSKPYTLGGQKTESLCYGEDFLVAFQINDEGCFTHVAYLVHNKPVTITRIVTEDYKDVNLKGDFRELHRPKNGKTQLRMELESIPGYAIKEKFIVTYMEHIYAN